ncbi:hypothetical protein G7085_11325 [Tessaracoccus sp. HDW20]|uniref:hypothetical protein n=1 Tax=Tessaracoccus coleopterorum TaxID=2714950 RepID=UPI0018D3172F|nr:hypothetical protein [Tessaracoccus coleopterorum]NHB85004.1 hypothetical protein [Tessaracoccus coleopterorum]
MPDARAPPRRNHDDSRRPYPPFALPARNLAVTVGDAPADLGAVAHIVFTGENPRRPAASMPDAQPRSASPRRWERHSC